MADDEVKIIDGVERRPIPVGEKESRRSIPLASQSMGRMLYAKNAKDQLNLAVDMSGHDRQLEAAGIKTGADADRALEESKQRQKEEREARLRGGQPRSSQPKARTLYARGEEYFDQKQQKKVVLVQLHAGVSRKTKTPCHKVVDRGGNAWLAKETDLVKVPGR